MITASQHLELDMNRRTHLLLATGLALAISTGLSWAQSPAALQSPSGYPSKPIRLVVPFAAGTAPDVFARLLVPALAESLSATVVVENVPGAGGTIGVDRVAKAAPDGHTLVLSGDAALVLTGGAYGVKPPYDTLRDLAPIAQLIITPMYWWWPTTCLRAPCRNWWRWCAASRASSVMGRGASASRNTGPASS
jgi:tripartite-type tricarboxylate transporter receptor subunit TctC